MHLVHSSKGKKETYMEIPAPCTLSLSETVSRSCRLSGNLCSRFKPKMRSVAVFGSVSRISTSLYIEKMSLFSFVAQILFLRLSFAFWLYEPFPTQIFKVLL